MKTIYFRIKRFLAKFPPGGPSLIYLGSLDSLPELLLSTPTSKKGPSLSFPEIRMIRKLSILDVFLHLRHHDEEPLQPVGALAEDVAQPLRLALPHQEDDVDGDGGEDHTEPDRSLHWLRDHRQQGDDGREDKVEDGEEQVHLLKIEIIVMERLEGVNKLTLMGLSMCGHFHLR